MFNLSSQSILRLRRSGKDSLMRRERLDIVCRAVSRGCVARLSGCRQSVTICPFRPIMEALSLGRVQAQVA